MQNSAPLSVLLKALLKNAHACSRSATLCWGWGLGVWVGASRNPVVTCSQAKTPWLKCLILSLILKINLPLTGMPSPLPPIKLGQQAQEGRLHSCRELPQAFLPPPPLPTSTLFKELKRPPFPNPGSLSPPRELHRPSALRGVPDSW